MAKMQSLKPAHQYHYSTKTQWSNSVSQLYCTGQDVELEAHASASLQYQEAEVEVRALASLQWQRHRARSSCPSFTAIAKAQGSKPVSQHHYTGQDAELEARASATLQYQDAEIEARAPASLHWPRRRA